MPILVARTLFMAAGSVLFASSVFPCLHAKGKGPPQKPPEVIEEKVDAATNMTGVQFLTKMTVKGEPAAIGFLQEAFEPQKDRKYELLVSLHGHGADPKGFLYHAVAARRKCYVLIVQGRTPAGEGFAWEESDREYVAGLAMHVIGKYQVDPKRVIIAGHSAGAHIALSTYRYAPLLFAGIITTAGAAAPDSAHYAARCVVFLGTTDPNYALASSVRSNFESKKRTAPGSLRIVTGLGHDIPEFFYFDQAMDWILETKARGWEVTLPKTPPVKEMKDFAHILMRHAGAEGAPASLKTPKTRILAEMKNMKKLLSGGLAGFFMEAARFSEDSQTAASGGLIDPAGLAAFSEGLRSAADALKPGEISEPVESPQGLHLVLKLKKAE